MYNAQTRATGQKELKKSLWPAARFGSTVCPEIATEWRCDVLRFLCAAFISWTYQRAMRSGIAVEMQVKVNRLEKTVVV